MQMEAFKEKMTQLGYMEESLLNATIESEAAKLQSEAAKQQVDKLKQEVTKLAGHRNQAQKIKHLQSLKEELLRLQRDNRLLEVRLSRPTV